MCVSLADAAQQARHGPCRGRLGDLRGVPAEARPVQDAADLQGGRQNLARARQGPRPQGHQPRQLPGGVRPLQSQEGD